MTWWQAMLVGAGAAAVGWAVTFFGITWVAGLWGRRSR